MGLYRGYIGLCRGYTEVISGVYRGYIGIMEKKVSPMFLLLLTDYLGASSLRLALCRLPKCAGYNSSSK